MSQISIHINYAHNKNELEQIEKDEVNMQIFKSKIKWTEEGENDFSYHLKKEISLIN